MKGRFSGAANFRAFFFFNVVKRTQWAKNRKKGRSNKNWPKIDWKNGKNYENGKRVVEKGKIKGKMAKNRQKRKNGEKLN